MLFSQQLDICSILKRCKTSTSPHFTSLRLTLLLQSTHISSKQFLSTSLQTNTLFMFLICSMNDIIPCNFVLLDLKIQICYFFRKSKTFAVLYILAAFCFLLMESNSIFLSLWQRKHLTRTENKFKFCIFSHSSFRVGEVKAKKLKQKGNKYLPQISGLINCFVSVIFSVWIHIFY